MSNRAWFWRRKLPNLWRYPRPEYYAWPRITRMHTQYRRKQRGWR